MRLGQRVPVWMIPASVSRDTGMKRGDIDTYGVREEERGRDAETFSQLLLMCLEGKDTLQGR